MQYTWQWSLENRSRDKHVKCCSPEYAPGPTGESIQHRAPARGLMGGLGVRFPQPLSENPNKSVQACVFLSPLSHFSDLCDNPDLFIPSHSYGIEELPIPSLPAYVRRWLPPEPCFRRGVNSSVLPMSLANSTVLQ